MTIINRFDDIKNAFYINLEHRVDRKEHVVSQLNNLGITASRFNAIKMENGAIGCSMSHLKLLQDAIEKKLDHILILEDDIQFLDPTLFKIQFDKFLKIHGNNWDVILLAGNNMPPFETIDETCIKVSRCQTTTGYLVNGHYIKILAQNVKMGLIHLFQNPTEHAKFAIDKFWFILQNNSRWYLITPLSVVQREDYSDIEKKVTNYKKIMMDLDKAELFKAIREMRKFKEKNQQNIY
uniref:Glycosyl transferase family 25 domain-containing protein n=1 Tax=viral metagenome TaxID=1070528 RepID=A0A6C0KQS7_9ZZZZ